VLFIKYYLPIDIKDSVNIKQSLKKKIKYVLSSTLRLLSFRSSGLYSRARFSIRMSFFCARLCNFSWFIWRRC